MDFREYTNGIKSGKLIYPEYCPGVPRMSTNAIGSLINKAVHDMPDGQCYVNVGVWHGFSLLCGMFENPTKKCVGVDNFSIFGGPRKEFRERFVAARSENHFFFDMDYKTYFEKHHQGKIGFYFYDAAHDYQNQFDGLKWAEPFLSDGALIMVDDTNSIEPLNGTINFIKQSPFEYKTILDVSIQLPPNGATDPVWWNGLMVIQKKGLKAKARKISEEEAEG